MLGPLEIHVDSEIPFQFRFDVRHLLDEGQFVNALRVVRDRPIAVDGNRDRPHSEESESHQPESEHGDRFHGGPPDGI